jgi:hypothetical protein
MRAPPARSGMRAGVMLPRHFWNFLLASITDANGVVTDLARNARDWFTSVTVSRCSWPKRLLGAGRPRPKRLVYPLSGIDRLT